MVMAARSSRRAPDPQASVKREVSAYSSACGPIMSESATESGLSGLSTSAGMGRDGKLRVRVRGSINMDPGTVMQ